MEQCLRGKQICGSICASSKSGSRGVARMNEKAIGQLSGLAGRLVAEGLINAQAASQAQKDASLERMPFVQYLVEKKNVDSQRLAEVTPMNSVCRCLI